MLTHSLSQDSKQQAVPDLTPDLDIDVESANPRLRKVLMGGDAIAALLAWSIPFLLPGSLLNDQVMNPTPLGLLVCAAFLAVAVFVTVCFIGTERLYLSRVATMRTVEIARLGRVALLVALTALIASRLLGESHLARVPVLTGMGVFVLLNVHRIGFTTWLNQARRHGKHTRSVILVGANDEAFTLFQHMRRHPELGYRVRGVVGRLDEVVRHDYGVPWMGEVAQLPRVLDESGVRGALVVGSALGRLQLNSAIRQLLERQVHVHMSTGINGIDHRRMQTHSLAYEPMVYVERAQLARWQLLTKRVLDLVLALSVLAVASIPMLVTAILVKAHDRGPVFFRQERVGRDGKLFHMVKFRSMVLDAEAQLAKLEVDNVRQGPLFKLAKDPRVTPIGRVLRASSIDELPQLLNVVKGDMSLVGPRPALPAEVAKFDEVLLARQNVMPGITGLWQVEARDNPDFTLYQRLDLFYVENWSVALDLSILLGTAKVVAMRGWSALGRKSNKNDTEEDLANTVLG